MKEETIELIKDINKKFGVGTIQTASQHKGVKWDRIPGDILTFDIITGGGIPKNNVCTIFGPWSSGKSSLGLGLIAEAQKQGGTAAYIYTEGTLDEDHLISRKVDLKELILAVKNNSEDVIDLVQTLALSKQVSLIVVDSLQGLVPDMVLENSAHDRTMGVEAFMNGQLIKKFLAATSLKSEEKPWCSLLLISHGTEVFASKSRKLEVKGGNAVKFFSVIIIEVKRGQPINEKGELIPFGGKDKRVGHEIKLSVYKNKTFPPYKTGVIHYITNDTQVGLRRGEVDPFFEIVRNGILYGLFEQKGAWIYYENAKWNGINKFVEWIRKLPEKEIIKLKKSILIKGIEQESNVRNTIDDIKDVNETTEIFRGVKNES